MKKLIIIILAIFVSGCTVLNNDTKEVFIATTGTPIQRLERELKWEDIESNQYYLQDTLVVEFYARKGHIFYKRFTRYLQTWYFIDGLSVKIIGEQSLSDYRYNLKYARKLWIDKGDYYVRGNRAIAISEDKYIMWRYDR